MKIKSLFVAVLLAAGVVIAPAHAAERPVVESFTFTPQEIDLQNQSTEIKFEMVISHPNGISDISTFLTLTNKSKDTIGTYLKRTDSNFENPKVTFLGSLIIPRNVKAGVYTFSGATVRNNPSAGYQYETEAIENKKIRAIVGAEAGILIRSGGLLGLEFDTFQGPSYDTALGIAYKDPLKFNPSNIPIWKVGETYSPSDYFELIVPTSVLKLSSKSLNVCIVENDKLKFINTGECSFTVSVAGDKDYKEKIVEQTAVIGSPRIKPSLTLYSMKNQDTSDLGKSIEIGRVFSASQGYVFPETSSPAICLPSGFYVKLIAGGTCKLTYQTPATSTYLASDLYTVSFEILKDGQPVVAPTPVVTPTPVATPTAKPVVKKTISCIKGTKSVKRTGTNPKCPKGFKLKR